jgi:hypothetical protein
VPHSTHSVLTTRPAAPLGSAEQPHSLVQSDDCVAWPLSPLALLSHVAPHSSSSCSSAALQWLPTVHSSRKPWLHLPQSHIYLPTPGHLPPEDQGSQGYAMSGLRVRGLTMYPRSALGRTQTSEASTPQTVSQRHTQAPCEGRGKARLTRHASQRWTRGSSTKVLTNQRAHL